MNGTRDVNCRPQLKGQHRAPDEHLLDARQHLKLGVWTPRLGSHQHLYPLARVSRSTYGSNPSLRSHSFERSSLVVQEQLHILLAGMSLGML